MLLRRVYARMRPSYACNFDIASFIKNCPAFLPLMRMLIWIVGLLALATSLNSSLYGGAYTRAFVAMIQDMHRAFGLNLPG